MGSGSRRRRECRKAKYLGTAEATGVLPEGAYFFFSFSFLFLSLFWRLEKKVKGGRREGEGTRKWGQREGKRSGRENGG